MTHEIKVRVDDVDAQFERARAAGAKVVEPPTDREYGERECSVEDLAGHRWQFSETTARCQPRRIWMPDRKALVLKERGGHTLRRRARGDGRDSSQDKNAVNAP